ncbi:MAG: response regulator [Campylobacterota bacterium]|nr:response regulator [Campylobacterota bacterium]
MFETLTALYVEDEEQISNIVKSILGNLFKELLFATNGQDGLDIYQNNKEKINVVITDINMPKMNGLTMIENIRQINQSVPIIITTAHNDKDFLHKAIELGVNKFVTKPMDMKVLISSIQKSVELVILKQELESQRLQHEQERIKSAKFAATGQLAAGITHEINTPLTYIKANFEMMGYDIEDLEESKEKDSLTNAISKINDGLRRIENIVGSMKEMSQHSSIEKQQSNIYASIVTSAILAYNKIKHVSNLYINGKLFDLDMDKNEFEFMANIQLQRMEQVWIIIINNAMDELMKIENFENRKLLIDISEDDNKITIIFKDNAGGIAQEVLPDIFEPFKGTKESSGMGVGLSIAKKIIRDQGNCKLEAYNEDNGAIFKITLNK